YEYAVFKCSFDDLGYCDRSTSSGPDSLGLTKLFKSGQSDLSSISSKNELSVSEIKHKAVIEVNEEESEAAAVTGGVIVVTSLGPIFYADHPFLFIIRDNRSGMILFLGRVNEF
ncbi:leukocyte elastase inhibitor-like, partial [Limulus polyphemus]|uniref:Leukocyte elastase inhibitor-like n=1 Tax=Limulus polyphemus TaxID=6850 RepID=A0ABM1C4B5_LIMPO